MLESSLLYSVAFRVRGLRVSNYITVLFPHRSLAGPIVQRPTGIPRHNPWDRLPIAERGLPPPADRILQQCPLLKLPRRHG